MLRKVIIADDEKLARESIKILLKPLADWLILAEASNGKEAVEMIDKLIPDLIFLDIDMPIIHGTEVLQRIKHKPHIIFTTAYDQYAIKAFDENAIDYLLKPYTDDRFYKALNKVNSKIEAEMMREKMQTILSVLQNVTPNKSINSTTGKITIKSGDKIYMADPSEINWISSAGNYVEFHLHDKSILQYDTISNIENKLDSSQFLRIHRSTIVNINCIKSMVKHQNGEYLIILKNGQKLKLSRSFKDAVQKILTLQSI